jgi:hypothetical protein
MTKPETPRGADALSKELDQALERQTKFVPDCDPAEYTTNVYNRVLVVDCDRITQTEKREMSDALVRKGNRSAGAICELSSECPNAKLLRYRFERIVCANRLWEVDIKWFFTCRR